MSNPTTPQPSSNRTMPSWNQGALSIVPAPDTEPDSASGSARPIRVLVISDVLLVRAGLRHVLASSTIALVGEAGNRDEALELALRERPNVILADLDLRSRALACVEEVRTAVPESRVIVLSDRTRSADHHVLIELGATGIVLKSAPPETLIKAITKVHAGEVWLDRANLAEVLARVARRRPTEDTDAAKIATLTRREREIIAYVGQGLKNNKIAESLFVSEATVRNHLTSILDKLGLADRFELAVYSFRQGLVQYPDSKERRRTAAQWPRPSEAGERRRTG